MKTRQAGKNARRALGISIVLAGGWVSPAFGMPPPMMSVQVSPRSAVTGLGATSQDGVGINLSTRYSERSDLQSGTTKVGNPNNEKTQSWQTTLLLDYRVTDSLTAILAVPYVNQTASYTGAKQTTQGLGDIAVYGKYSLYKTDATSEVLALAGVELPTGSTKKGDSSGVFPITQQPGSGSTDFIVGAAAVWGLPVLTAYGDFSYKINGSESYKFGNFLALNAGANYVIPSMEQFSLVGEVNAEIAARDKSDLSGPGVLPGGEVRDTGYKKIYFTPGIQWRPGKDWALNFNAQVPVYQNLNGTQLASGVNYNLGVSLRF
ncbi:MAG: hypothetical protein WAW75_01715 [Gallionella sp.]